MFQSDRFGFNNPDWEWDQPHTEWVIIGDSYAQGACVGPGEDIGGQLRSTTGESVINLGSGGNGPLTELATLKEYAESRRPSKVLWFYCEVNDPDDLEREKSAPTLLGYLRRRFSQDLIQRQAEIDDSLLAYIADSDKGGEPASRSGAVLQRFVRIPRFHHIRQRLHTIESTPHLDPTFSVVLREARDRVAAWGGKLYFVYLPDYERYADLGKLSRSLYMKRNAVSQMVVDLANDLGIPVIDIHEDVFADHPDWRSLFPLRMGGHYNAKGYHEVSKAVLARVGAAGPASNPLHTTEIEGP